MSTTGNLVYSNPPADGSPAWVQPDFDPALASEPPRNWTEDIRKVEIKDARGNEDKYTLDTAALQFYRRPAKLTRFVDDEEIKAEYYPESIELIKELTGARMVIPFDHSRFPTYSLIVTYFMYDILPAIRRRRPGMIDDGPQNRQPVPLIHVDQTTKSAIARLRREVPSDQVEALLQRRFQIVNLWRPISHPAEDWPLALCDYRSLDVDEDLIVMTLKFAVRDGQNYSVKYNPNHRWVYKSAMDPEDFVLFKWSVRIRLGQ